MPMAKTWRLGAVLCVAPILLYCGAFLHGLYVGSYKTFPFEYVHKLKHAFSSSTGIRLDVYSDTAGRSASPCPATGVVILAIGQSNAANALPSFGEKAEAAQAFNFFNGSCYPIEDPVLGATGDRGSLWPQFAQRLSAAMNNAPVVMITSAIEGSTVRQWLAPPTQYVARVERQMAMAQSMGLVPRAVIWHQGEADAVEGTSQVALTHRRPIRSPLVPSDDVEHVEP